MRIVLDMQGAQSMSRFRGIGRYSRSLATAIVRNQGKHEVILALNGLFPKAVEEIRASFQNLLPPDNIRVWTTPGPVRECEHGNFWRRKSGELLREGFLGSLQPDVVHVMSVFEGYLDDAVTSVKTFDLETPTSVSLFDLIPLVNPNEYLSANPIYEEYYLRKIDHLRRATLLLAISDSTKKEAIRELGIPSESIVTVSLAADELFRPIALSTSDANTFKGNLGITRPFALYVGAADPRKNLPRLVRAYAALDPDLRDSTQLVLAGKIPDNKKFELEHEARKAGVGIDNILFPGHVPDHDLVKLYNLCEALVLPSWHEGFGLPVLEAMSCGSAVIGSNTAGIPEVIGREDALFDPGSEVSISEKLAQVLSDDTYRSELENHGLKYSKQFTWDKAANSALSAFEELHKKASKRLWPSVAEASRPKLAYVSPLPPKRSGISKYSAELIPHLSRYYDIDVIADQSTVTDKWIRSICSVREPDYLLANSESYDRVLYHFGNSPFHAYMFRLLGQTPGIVVLHDFFLSNCMVQGDGAGIHGHGLAAEIYHSHGYTQMKSVLLAEEWRTELLNLPCNLNVLQNSLGIISHSDYSQEMAEEWYGSLQDSRWSIIPSLRSSPSQVGRNEARRALGFDDEDFVVCSFGLVNPTKLNHEILNAWLSSSLANSEKCKLILVGENHGGEYGKYLLDKIHEAGLQDRIQITGWVDDETYSEYLAAADLAIQLRTQTRGETSRTVLDCMAWGIPTIVNAHGPLADVPDETVCKLSELFTQEELIGAIEGLWQDAERRQALSSKSRQVIAKQHSPRECAERYFYTIEGFYGEAQRGLHNLIRTVANLDDDTATDADYLKFAEATSVSLPPIPSQRRLLLDVTASRLTERRTGIERVSQALMEALLEKPPSGYRVEPVYLSREDGTWRYRFARRYVLERLDISPELMSDDIVDPRRNDTLIGLDLSGQALTEAAASGLFRSYRANGVSVYFIVYDLLPIFWPKFFPPGADSTHSEWIETVAHFDGAICISQAVANELQEWIQTTHPQSEAQFEIDWFHLGSDLEGFAQSEGLPNDAEQILSELAARPSFLMVGTIEPRKGHLQALRAFEHLWLQAGYDVNLVIVGEEGWKHLPDHKRRSIPQIVEHIRTHRELNARLYWLEGISDEYLQTIYSASTCLLAASECEGFGLPIIEAARHRLPIIARDIPVFREISGSHSFYFDGSEPTSIAYAIQEWLELYKANKHPRPDDIPITTWERSASQLREIVNENG